MGFGGFGGFKPLGFRGFVEGFGGVLGGYFGGFRRLGFHGSSKVPGVLGLLSGSSGSGFRTLGCMGACGLRAQIWNKALRL